MLVYSSIFFISLAAIFHTYVLYPLVLNRLSKDGFNPSPDDSSTELLVDILIAAYNEESVIEEKLQSILKSDYDLTKVRVIVGSDGSDDRTDEIVLGMQHPSIVLQRFDRGGKTSVVNKLMSEAQAPLVILTDANVLFSPKTIAALVHRFKDAEIGLVGADIHPRAFKEEGIAHQETKYLQRENLIKYQEGELWGTMMGAFGGCYALRRELFVPVPEHFLVDDFHITMSVLKQGHKAVLSREAVCYEDVSSKLSEEFRRKVRMSTGNFQNLKAFSGLLFNKRRGLSFAFISHKVLRWLTPVFMLLAIVSSGLLMRGSEFFGAAFCILILLCVIPFIDQLLKSIGLRSRLLRFITYFVSMNLALLVGMFRSFKKVERAIWEPTERNL